MPAQWPRGSSPTARGYVQGLDSYCEADMQRMEREYKRIAEEKRQRAQVGRDEAGA